METDPTRRNSQLSALELPALGYRIALATETSDADDARTRSRRLHAYRARSKEHRWPRNCMKVGNDNAPVKHDQQQLAQILLDRRTKRRSLTAWARHCGYEPARHHKLIVSRLEAVARGEIRRLMIIAPPGSAKSTYASILFP